MLILVRGHLDILTDLLVNKVEVQNNILHTLREANRAGEKAIFHFSFPASLPPPFPLSLSGL